MARKAKYEVNRARLHSFLAHIRVGSYAQPGVPPFFTDPARGCATVDPDVMFPEAVEEVPDAQRVCRHCPFKTACHEWAVDTAQAYGVWGGITEQERRREIFARREQAAA
jgi:WhiB family redox-sensing transcriptional regulator